MQQNFVVELETCPPKKGRPSILFWNHGQKQHGSMWDFISSHLKKGAKKCEPATWWMVIFLPRMERQCQISFWDPSNVGRGRVTFCDRSIDESCYFFVGGTLLSYAIITQIGQPGWHNALRPQMFQHTDIHMMILNILPLWKILNIQIQQQKWSNIPETSNHSLHQRHFKASWCFWLIFPGAETSERLPQAHGMARMLTKLSKRHLLSLPLKIV